VDVVQAAVHAGGEALAVGVVVKTLRVSKTRRVSELALWSPHRC